MEYEDGYNYSLHDTCYLFNNDSERVVSCSLFDTSGWLEWHRTSQLRPEGLQGKLNNGIELV